MALTEHVLGSPAALVDALYDWSVPLLHQRLQEQKSITLLLSGGTTPLPYYRKLALTHLPWKQIQLALVDERWVDTKDELSNEAAIRSAFSTNPQVLQQLLGMKNEAPTAQEGVNVCNQRYQALPWPPTLAILGMGGDGHTASLFPGAEGLDEALTSESLVAAISAKPSAVTGVCTERMTLTLSALLQSENVALVITGKEKLCVYQKALEEISDELPISLLLERARDVEVFWCP